jgi:hypothetical protein
MRATSSLRALSPKVRIIDFDSWLAEVDPKRCELETLLSTHLASDFIHSIITRGSEWILRDTKHA